MSFKDNAKATVAMETALGTPQGLQEDTGIVVTADTMKLNSAKAAKRGAEWLDAHFPGWVDRARAVIEPFPKVLDMPYYMQVGLLPELTQEEARAVLKDPVRLQAAQQARERVLRAHEGDQRYTPLFTEEEHAQGAAFLAALLGMPVPDQETNLNRENQIDLAWYGFVNFWMVAGFGKLSGDKPTKEQLLSTGYCKDKAAMFLADAWNHELQQRRGK